MSIPKEQLAEEKDYLEKVTDVLYRHIAKSKDIVERSRNEVIELNRSMMDDIGNDVQSLGKFVDAYSYLVEIDSRAGAMIGNEKEHSRLLTMIDSPYFARMDFTPDFADSPMKVYIGIGSLIDEDTMDFYVFDWRSPVAGMYYDFELGEASYDAPSGKVSGNVSLKRHFTIWKGEIKSVYDSSLAIDDDILSEALSKSADSKMQTIVCTIQREQNKIIRDKKSLRLIAFGPAGSGKTSIAMQRAAFFLYTYRDTILPSNLMIFSPNNVFGDYISEVLPKLGESNIKSTTFNTYAATQFPEGYKFLSSAEFLEFSVHGSGIRKRAAALKASDALFDAIIERIELLKSNSPGFPDAVYGGECIMTGAEIERLYSEDFSYLSIQGRMNKLFARISVFAKEIYKKCKKEALAKIDRNDDPIIVKENLVKCGWEVREEYHSFLNRFSEILSADPKKIYLDVLKSLDIESWKFTKKALDNNFVQSEDAAPLLYVFSATREIKNEVKYLIIDEAQDYTKLHYMCIKNCFPKANITFLGDTNQSVCPISPLVTADDLKSVFPDASVSLLTKSYRSTAEISEFCGSLLGLTSMDYMKRSGDPVTKVTASSEDEMMRAMVDSALKYKSEGKTCAIIYPTVRECFALFEKYGKDSGLRLVTGLEKSFHTGLVIIPVYMAKGLEFDSVIIPENSYRGEELKHLLYTASTRALHSLKLFEF